MKKVLAIMLALVLALSMTACGGGSIETGVIDAEANTWKNDFAGIKCDFGSEWTFLTEEEIQENNEKALDAIGEDYAKAIKNADVFTDMMATRPTTTSSALVSYKDSVSVTFEKLNFLQKTILSEEKYAEASIESTKNSLKSMGMSSVKVTVDSTTFAGKTHACLDITASYFGQAVYEKLVIVKCGSYMVLFTAFTSGSNGCDAILDNFKKI